ncbi:hypothetical protein BaRGS_00037779 [Batillaria attramentaria]|uniref:Uncharacterized protein n=1 Tax=Batillaria attramentaria TaxID=370345 RepID=A0ABD0J832_9CAEN
MAGCGTVKWLVQLSMVALWMIPGVVWGKVRLEDHGYEGIVIAINPYLKQEETMLRRLEKITKRRPRPIPTKSREICCLPAGSCQLGRVWTAAVCQLDGRVLLMKDEPEKEECAYIYTDMAFCIVTPSRTPDLQTGNVPRFQDDISNFQDGMPTLPDDMPNFQDGMPNFQDGMLNFQDDMLNFQDGMLNFQDDMPNF